jgi:hypothetical protein
MNLHVDLIAVVAYLWKQTVSSLCAVVLTCSSTTQHRCIHIAECTSLPVMVPAS